MKIFLFICRCCLHEKKAKKLFVYFCFFATCNQLLALPCRLFHAIMRQEKVALSWNPANKQPRTSGLLEWINILVIKTAKDETTTMDHYMDNLSKNRNETVISESSVKLLIAYF